MKSCFINSKTLRSVGLRARHGQYLVYLSAYMRQRTCIR